MKKTLTIYLLLLLSIPILAQPPEFDYIPNNISGGLIATVQVNGIPASDLDYIAAFDEDNICAGAVQLLAYYGQTFCNLQIYGDDPSTPDVDEGVNTGETFTLKLWIAATNQILDNPLGVPAVTGWNNSLNGAPIEGYSFSDNVVLNFTTGAPTPGNECIDPIPYPGNVVNGTCVAGYDFSIFGDSGQSPLPTCDFGDDAYAWFSWTAPIISAAGEPINLNFDAGYCDIGIEFYSTDCLSPASNCLSNNNGLVTGLVQGVDYLIQIWDDGPGDFSCDFCLSLAPPPPPNDECTGATPYPGDVVNGTCVTGYDFSQYTDSGLSPSATCDSGDATGWFTFTAPIISAAGDPITLEWDRGINCSIGIDVYETDCSTPVPASCLNNTNGLLTSFIQGNNYLLLIWDDSDGSSDCDFCLAIPVIDGCTDTNACNFTPQASVDDGSCRYIGEICDDGNPASENDMINSDCACAGTFPPGCNDIILNGSFETGDFTNWIFTDLYDPFFPNSVDCYGNFNTGFGFSDINPLTGGCMAVNGFDGNGPGFITLHQEVTIPTNANSADFTFSWWVAYNLMGFGANLNRLFEVQVLPVGGGAPLAIPYTFTAMAGTVEAGTGWNNVTVDLSAFSGQSIWVCFVETIPESFTGPAQLAIDEVSLVVCTNICEEAINGGIIVADPECDVSGIDITIFAPDGTSIIVTTNTNGIFSVSGGPFPCGDYTAAFTDPASLPVCYTTTGATDPIIFTVDGEGNGDDGPFFFANPEIPTLSQWGLISLALLLMIYGALKLHSTTTVIRLLSKIST